METILKKIKNKIIYEQRKVRYAHNDAEYNLHKGKVEAYKEIKEYLLELEKTDEKLWQVLM